MKVDWFEKKIKKIISRGRGFSPTSTCFAVLGTPSPGATGYLQQQDAYILWAHPRDLLEEINNESYFKNVIFKT